MVIHVKFSLSVNKDSDPLNDHHRLLQTLPRPRLLQIVASPDCCCCSGSQTGNLISTMVTALGCIKNIFFYLKSLAPYGHTIFLELLVLYMQFFEN